VGGIPEVVEDGEIGFLVRPGDVESMAQKITLLLRTPELRNRMGGKARSCTITKFEISSVLEQLFTVYDALVL
jgi:glycosyltransferase involved in cell wall biosynthesis